MLHLPRTFARLLAMCAFYAAQWKERIVHFLFRGDWRSAELVSGIGIISTGIVKIHLVTEAFLLTPLGIAYRFTGVADIITGVFIIGTVLWSHGKDGNAKARSIVNSVQFCLWLITAYIYWMGYTIHIFDTQAAFEDHFAAIIVMLIIVILDSVNIASIEGLEKKQEGGMNG
jgi:hypothetical protein